MSKSSISASEFTELLPSPPYASAAWEPFSLQVVEAPREMTTVFTDHILGLHVSGKHRIRQELGGRTRDGRSESGAVNLVPAHLRFSTEANAPVRAIVLFIPEEFVSRVIVEHWEGDPRNVEIMWQFLGRDRVIEDVMTRLAMEANKERLIVRPIVRRKCLRVFSASHRPFLLIDVNRYRLTCWRFAATSPEQRIGLHRRERGAIHYAAATR